jgi:hypothetical protein
MLSYVQPVYVRKTANESVTNSTTLQNDDELLLSVEANATYEMRAFLIFTAGTTGDLKYGWTAPAGATMDWNMGGEESTIGVPTGMAYWAANSIGGTDVAAGMTVSSTVVIARPEGLLRVSGTAGTFQLQWAQGAADAGTATTVKTGSWLMLRRLQ